MPRKPAVGKKVAPNPLAAKKTTSASKNANPLFEKRARNFGIGRALTLKRDMTHFVKWPKYVRLQRQRRVLLQRLKVPPQVNQFTKTLDRNTCTFKAEVIWPVVASCCNLLSMCPYLFRPTNEISFFSLTNCCCSH